MTSTNKHIKDYDKLRPFIRLISYGCYHRSQFPRFKARNYDENLRILRFCLPEEHLAETRLQKNLHVHFLGDTYHGTDNYLARSFAIKSISLDNFLYYITILQTLAASPGAAYSFNTLTNTISEKFQAAFPKEYELEPTKLRRRLTELCDTGLIQKTQNSKSYSYAIAGSPLLSLNTDEMLTLRSAIAFYKNVALLSIPGTYLEQTLSSILPAANPHSNYYQFKNNNFVRILDEVIVQQLLAAIHEKKLVKLHRNGKCYTVFPLSILTDYQYNRQYLSAAERNHRHLFRIDNIDTSRIAETAEPPLEETIDSPSPIIEIKLKTDTRLECTMLLSRIRERLHDAVIIETLSETECLGKIPCKDPLKLLPWLRTFHPFLEILPSQQHNLRSRMKKDIEEALTNYHEPVY